MNKEEMGKTLIEFGISMYLGFCFVYGLKWSQDHFLGYMATFLISMCLTLFIFLNLAAVTTLKEIRNTAKNIEEQVYQIKFMGGKKNE